MKRANRSEGVDHLKKVVAETGVDFGSWNACKLATAAAENGTHRIEKDGSFTLIARPIRDSGFPVTCKYFPEFCDPVRAQGLQEHGLSQPLRLTIQAVNTAVSKQRAPDAPRQHGLALEQLRIEERFHGVRSADANGLLKHQAAGESIRAHLPAPVGRERVALSEKGKRTIWCVKPWRLSHCPEHVSPDEAIAETAAKAIRFLLRSAGPAARLSSG
ncbi:hypothetical protein [Hyphomicrobium sp.]|uniref:hypothetical protein n=1 Tax=Hyphomicrobium sp. TaxID=82 RepID=UPI002D786CE1|nr:hypothetical protein [Hyphomicrobium sp.]HET6389785.1 hypothetical protein [Hyphomicrobium sp.]